MLHWWILFSSLKLCKYCHIGIISLCTMHQHTDSQKHCTITTSFSILKQSTLPSHGLLHDEEVFWRKNHIEGLTDEARVWKNDENKVAEMNEGYYQRLFTTSNLTHMNEVLNSVERVVTEEMRRSLLIPYTEDEFEWPCSKCTLPSL